MDGALKQKQTRQICKKSFKNLQRSVGGLLDMIVALVIVQGDSMQSMKRSAWSRHKQVQRYLGRIELLFQL